MRGPVRSRRRLPLEEGGARDPSRLAKDNDGHEDNKQLYHENNEINIGQPLTGETAPALHVPDPHPIFYEIDQISHRSWGFGPGFQSFLNRDIAGIILPVSTIFRYFIFVRG